MLGRHITSRILSVTFIALLVVTVTLVLTQFVRLGPLFLGPWVRPSDAACLVAVLPFLTLALPASLALAMGLVAASLSRRGERAILASSGISRIRVVAAPLLLCLAGTVLTALLSLGGGPWAFTVLERGLASLATRAVFHSLPTGRFLDLPDGGILFARHKTDSGREIVLTDVILSRDEGDGGWLTVSASRARILHHGAGRCTFVFRDALLQADGWDDGRMQADVGELTVPVDLGRIISARRDTMPRVLGMPTWRMDPSGPPAERYHLHRRISVTLASLLVLLASTFTFLSPRLQRPWSAPALVASTIVGYHALMRGGEEVSMKGWISPELGAWLPAAALLLVCIGLLARPRFPRP